MTIIVSCSHQIHPFVVLTAFQQGLMNFDEAISSNMNQELGLSENLVAKIRHSTLFVVVSFSTLTVKPPIQAHGVTLCFHCHIFDPNPYN